MVSAPPRTGQQETCIREPDGSAYEGLATMLAYPDEGTCGKCRAWLGDRGDDYPEAAVRILGWLTVVEKMQVWELQELYTRTFDLNPCCTLDVGYYLFGEDYQRGAFMAQVRSELDKAGIPCDEDLPDHLPHLLRWLEHVRGTEDHVEMVAECLLPVLRKMDEAMNAPPAGRQGVRGARQEARRDNPYRGLLQGLAMVLERDLECLDARTKEGVGAR